MKDFVTAMGGPAPSFFERDPKEFTQQLALLLKLAKLAETEKLDQKAPTKQRLEYAKATILMQSVLDAKVNHTQLDQSMLQAYYDQHKAEFTRLYAKMIRVAYGTDGKPRTEVEAKAKIEDLSRQLAAGADFSTLAKENSDDGATRDKGGDLPPIAKNTSGISAKVKAAVLALQPGTVSAPVQDSNAYLLFRLEKAEPAPMNAVSPELINAVRQENLRKLIEDTKNSMNIKFLDENYFKPNPSAAAPHLPPGLAPPKSGTPAPPKP